MFWEKELLDRLIQANVNADILNSLSIPQKHR
jgi:hypothetical protein